MISMKKFAFLGAVSAIALMCTPALADPISVDENQVPVVTGDGSAAAATKDSLNKNDIASYNGNLSGNTDSSDNSDNSTSVTANNNDLLSNNETNVTDSFNDNSTESKVYTKTTTVNKTKTTNVAVVKDNELFSNNTTNSYNTLTDQSTNTNVKFDDVMANVNVTSTNVGGVAAMAFSSDYEADYQGGPYPVLNGKPGGPGGPGKDCCASTSASTGSIGGVMIQSTRGITAANLNTGVASQANNISLNAQVNNAQ
jgi:hypothetical protein